MTTFLQSSAVGMSAAGAVVLFLVTAAVVAYIAFRVLRRAVRLAFRTALLAAILMAAVVGSAAIWWFGGRSRVEPERRRPAPAVRSR